MGFNSVISFFFLASVKVFIIFVVVHFLRTTFLSRFFGCGLPFPAKLEGCRVLDLGSGSGRDCYAFSKLVGPDGHVTGVDMTEELVMTRTRSRNLFDTRFFFY